MRQVIKGDGSDGTAALKAYLLAHDNVLSQDLYEFTKPGIGVALGAGTTVYLQTPFATRIPEDDESDPLPGGNWGDAFATGPAGTTLQRWTSHPLAGTNGPNAILGPASGRYGAPGGDDPTAPPRSEITKIVIGCYASATPGTSSGLGIVGLAAPGYAIEYSLDGGATWTMLVSNPGSPLPSTFFSLDITAVIAALPGGIASFDFTGIKILVTQASSTWWDIPGPGPYPPDDHAPGAVFIVSGAGAYLTIGSGSGGIVAPSPLGKFCDAASPLTYAGQVYAPANIKNSGFKSKIGLDVDSLTLEWTFRGDEAMVTDPGTGATILTMLQAFRYGLWAGAWLKWRRTYMPTFGDCDSLGAVSMFRGRIADVQVDRLTARVTVNSVTEMFNRKVPQQLIEANNRSGQIGPGLPPDLDPDPAQWTTFECVAGHGGTVQKIVARQTAPTADQVYAAGTFDLGYLLFQASPLQNFVAQVQRYDVEAGYNVFYLFKPLYVDPHLYSLTFVGFVPVPKDQTISGAGGVELPPFPSVPLPEQAV